MFYGENLQQLQAYKAKQSSGVLPSVGPCPSKKKPSVVAVYIKKCKKELTTWLKKIDKKRSEIDKNIHCIGTLNVILTSVSVGYRMNCLKSTAPDFLG